MKPFLFLGSRSEAADSGYDAMLRYSGLGASALHGQQMERDELGRVDHDAWSGIVVGGGPLNVRNDVLIDSTRGAWACTARRPRPTPSPPFSCG